MSRVPVNSAEHRHRCLLVPGRARSTAGPVVAGTVLGSYRVAERAGKLTEERTPPPDLAELIRRRLDENGWDYADMAAAIGDQLTKKRLEQLGGGRRTKEFPEPRTLILIAQALEVPPATVVLAAARSVGIDARTDADELAELLPPGTHRLPGRIRVAVAALIRAVVAETPAGNGAAGPVDAAHPPPPGTQAVTLEWPHVAESNDISPETGNRA